MPPPSLVFDEAASLDALRQFVTTALPEVPGVDVYRARPSSVPGKWGLSVVMRPLTPLPLLGSPMGEESDAAQRQRVQVVVTTGAAGTWTLRLLGRNATYVAPANATPTQVRNGLSAAAAALALPVLPVTLVSLAGPPVALEVLANVAGVSMLAALTVIPAGGAGAVTVVDDSIRRCTYNWGTWTIRVVVREIPSAAGPAPCMVGPYVERLRLMMQSSSIPVVNGSAYPYLRDRMATARMHWRETLGPFDADVQQDNLWVRGIGIDFVFDAPSGLLHDVPSLDVMGQTGPLIAAG